VDPRTGLDNVEKILDPTGTLSLTLRSSSPSQSLYRLRYPVCSLGIVAWQDYVRHNIAHTGTNFTRQWSVYGSVSQNGSQVHEAVKDYPGNVEIRGRNNNS
jgi:hypothetical protein